MASALAPPEAPSRPGESSSERTPSVSRPHRRTGTPIPRNAVWNRTPWKWFFSLRVGIVLLVVLAVASTIGTLIDPLERAQAAIYYTWWYKLLLVALAVNMSCATVQTILLKVLPSRALRLQTSPTFFCTARPNGACAFEGDIDRVAAEFRRQGCETLVDGDAGVARHGWIGRLGGPVSHAGLVIVLLAGFASSWVAREGVVSIPEGRSVASMTLRDGKKTEAPLGFTLSLDDFSTGYFPRTRIPSHFESTVTASTPDGILYRGPVEVNSSPLIKGWRLHQTSYQDLPGKMRRIVSVTPPGAPAAVSIEISGGQSAPVPGLPDASFALDDKGAWTIRDKSETVASGTLSGGHASALSLRADRFEPDFVLGADRKIASRSTEPNNPALQVTLLSDGAPAARQWLFGRADMKQFSHGDDGRFRLELVDSHLDGETPAFTVEVAEGTSGLLLGRVTVALGAEEPVGATAAAAGAGEDTSAGWTVVAGESVASYATVLTLTRNPAIPVIYAGCGLMMAGLVLGFFVRRRDVWFMVDRAEGVLRVVAHYRNPADEFDAATASVLGKLESSSAAC